MGAFKVQGVNDLGSVFIPPGQPAMASWKGDRAELENQYKNQTKPKASWRRRDGSGDSEPHEAAPGSPGTNGETQRGTCVGSALPAAHWSFLETLMPVS